MIAAGGGVPALPRLSLVPLFTRVEAAKLVSTLLVAARMFFSEGEERTRPERRALVPTAAKLVPLLPLILPLVLTGPVVEMPLLMEIPDPAPTDNGVER